jgi:plastocyanin
VRALLALALTGVAALAAAPAVAVPPDAVRKPQKKRVEVVDNFYSPRKLTVNLKSRINWVWTDGSADVHDVKLLSAPKGFKKFQTEPGSAGYTYSKTLTKPGVYKFICTLHEEDNMRMTITVRHWPAPRRAWGGGAARRPPARPCLER